MTKIIYVALLATLARAVKLTNSDYDVVPGKEFTIKWTEAQGPVTLRLKSGPQSNLQTVEEITSGHSGESFTWAVPSSFDSSQYALEIEDGSGDINYSVQFPIEGDGSSLLCSKLKYCQ
ncbi:extracellular matrix [Fusarium albosuccineum]|uniref:Extracellular matrix n=1 Tax=Fusarium albosuccineum TaxID=1237068 RepID=A0A8H4PJS7_9HYPO|nr:extracellular matrix [Fusarium albosuccineum]